MLNYPLVERQSIVYAIYAYNIYIYIYNNNADVHYEDYKVLNGACLLVCDWLYNYIR